MFNLKSKIPENFSKKKLQKWFHPKNLRTLFSELLPVRTKCQTSRKSKYQSKYRTSLNVESNQKFDVINTELLGTRNESKKSKKSTEQDGMNEHVEGGKNSASKPKKGSEPDKVSDDKKGTNTVETSKKANKETKSSEDKLEGDFAKDALKTGPETSGEIKDKEVGKHKVENSPGQDEKKKSIEGKEKMECLHHSEVQSQKHASCSEYATGWLPCDHQVDMVSLMLIILSWREICQKKLIIISLLQVVHRLDAS